MEQISSREIRRQGYRSGTEIRMSPQTTARIEAPHRSEQGDFGILKPLFHLFHRLLLPAMTLFVLLCAIPILSYPPGRDQGTYLEIGQSLLRGKHLYAQLWDNKPPGIFVTYAVIAKLFGKVSRPSRTAAHRHSRRIVSPVTQRADAAQVQCAAGNICRTGVSIGTGQCGYAGAGAGLTD